MIETYKAHNKEEAKNFTLFLNSTKEQHKHLGTVYCPKSNTWTFHIEINVE
jgi:hypothetical protein